MKTLLRWLFKKQLEKYRRKHFLRLSRHVEAIKFLETLGYEVIPTVRKDYFEETGKVSKNSKDVPFYQFVKKGGIDE